MRPTIRIGQFRRPRRARLLQAALLAAVTLIVAACATGPAWAAGSSHAFESGGQNVGNALAAWGKALLFSLAAIMGIGALLKRSVSEGVTVLIIVLILGAFLYDQSDTEALIRNVWSAIGGG
jgi:hypothetical protein